MIKVAIVAPYPAAVVLAEECLKARLREVAKEQHPAPWVRALCRELSKKTGMEVEVFSHSRHIIRTHKAEKEGVKYTFVPKYEPLRCNPYHFYLPALLQILPLIKQFNPDIVHGFGTESAYGLLAVNQKKPGVVFIQGIQEKYAPYYDMHKIKVVIRRMLERYVVRKADGLIAETDFARRWAQSLRPNVNVKVIPHAFTESFLAGRPDFEKRRIICIGTLSRIKGCTTVLEAFYLGVKRSPDLFKQAELVYIGGGPLAAVLKSRAKEYGITESVRFRGSVAHEKILYEMEKACMLVVGSRMDTSPNVITEAHAVGIPVIGTNAGGIPEMIDYGRDGFVVPVDDADTMSQRMEFLLNDMKRCAEMGRSGRNKIRKLNDPSRVADDHIAFYNEILAGKHK